MSKVVEVSPTTRHEGHSKLVLKVNDAGIIERGDWLSITPVRGIEKLCVGKTMHQAPKISSRVCGICPIAHTLAGVGAMEASIGCEIPQDAYLLRTILQCANRLHSHALHNILTLPAFCNIVSAKSSLININSAQVSTKGQIRGVAKNAETPAELNYRIAVTPDANSGSGFAEGTVMTSFQGTVLEARGTSNETSAENTWKDTTEVTGGIKNFQKAFAYQSGFRL